MEKKKLLQSQKTPQSSRVKNSSRGRRKVSSVSFKKESQTMAELLAQVGYQIKGLKRGQQIEGRVSEILPKKVLIDIGGKTEGVVLGREFEAASDFIKNLKVGDRVLVSVVSPEDRFGQTILSLKRAAYSSAWDKFAKAKEENEEVEVLVKETIQSGLIVSGGGINGFIPFSQLGANLQKKVKDLPGKTLRVKVLEVNQALNRLVFSEKEVSEKEKIEKTKKLLKKVKIEQIFEGEVSLVLPFGIFVKIKIADEEIEGLVHVSEVSWEKISDLASLFKEGDRVKVLVLDKDEKEGRLSLSIKRTLPDPWQEKIKKYPPESLVQGKVVRLISSGAIVEIEEGVEGFLPISKIPFQQKIDVGDRIDCFVEKIDLEKRRLSLGLILKEKPVGYK